MEKLQSVAPKYITCASSQSPFRGQRSQSLKQESLSESLKSGMDANIHTIETAMSFLVF